MQIMHFRHCRICRSDQNLKFTIQQLRQINKSQRKNGQKKLPGTAPTLGNICHDCDEQLQNFHQLDGGDDSDIDIDIDVDSGTATLSGDGLGTDIGVRRRAETPVIVDDDKLLYDLFFQKVKRKRNDIRNKEGERENALHVKCKARGDLTQISLGSDGDTEIIEVLTSRETTPVPTLTLSSLPLQQKLRETVEQKIVAVIDLEVEEEDELAQLTENNTIKDVDDDDIVFHCVESTAVLVGKSSTKKPPTKRRKKTYAESELRLIASLSLVSSDSETEVLPAVKPNNQTVNPFVSGTATTTQSTGSRYQHQCKNCNVRLPDAESLLVHERVHSGVICPVCHMGFSTSQRLVHHMRFKHRSYEGEELCERPRCAQDSAMTIRLRYLHRYTYYECQLCGRIDAVFKEHKQHVLQSHAAESKSLKDPMMKELKCPVCKERCGMQQMLLCRHLVGSHSVAEYKPHLKEVSNLHTCGWNLSRQKSLEQTARVYQLAKLKSYFFECKQCLKMVAGYVHHVRHLNTHSDAKAREQKSPKVALKVLKKTAHATKEIIKPKRAELSDKEQGTAAALTAQGQQIKRNEVRQRKLTKKALLAAMVKVKIKPPLRHFRTQKYACKHCRLVCKGFHRLNLHKLATHAAADYQPCNTCRLAFSTPQALQIHKDAECARRCWRKRATNTNCGKTVDENCNTAWKPQRLGLSAKQGTPNELLPQSAHDDHTASIWLRDLLHISEKRKHTANTTAAATVTDSKRASNIDWNHCGSAVQATAQCAYCTHLFSTATELDAHERVHEQRQEMQSIKRRALPAPH